MSEVLKRVVCVRLAMSESLARSRRPTAEGRRFHRAGAARRRAGSCRRFAFGRAARAHDGPMDRKAAMSSGSLGGGMGSGTAGAHERCRRPLRGLALGLVVLSALAVLASAQPAVAQAEIELLSATLTPTFATAGNPGCSQQPGVPEAHCNNRMTDHDITEDGVTYNIVNLFLAPTGRLNIYFNPAITSRLTSMTLHVGSSSFAWLDGSTTFFGSLISRYWNNSGLTWALAARGKTPTRSVDKK